MPRRSTLPAGRPEPAVPASRLSPAKRAMVKELWLRDGMSPRRIAAHLKASRRPVEDYCRTLATRLVQDIPSDLSFEKRFLVARERRLEAIAADVSRHEAEVATLDERRAKAAADPERTGEYLRLTSIILEHHAEMSSLRHEWSQTFVMVPPREVLVAEVERVRLELAPPEERQA